MADLFSTPRKSTNPSSKPVADNGIISDAAAAELKAQATKAAGAVKASAGKVAGELAAKAKSTWIPAVKARTSEMPRVSPKTWAIGVGLALVVVIGAYAWHSHSTTPPVAPSNLGAATAPSLSTSTPATVPVPKVYGWNVAAGMKVLNADTGPKQAFTCNLSFNADIGGGWAHQAASIPGFIVALDATDGIIQASTAEVAQQALSASNFVVTAKCLTAAQLQAQVNRVKKPAPPVEAQKPAPLPVFLPTATTPVPAFIVAKPTSAAGATPVMAQPAAMVAAPIPKPVRTLISPKPKASSKPDTFEKDADAQLNAFFKQH